MKASEDRKAKMRERRRLISAGLWRGSVAASHEALKAAPTLDHSRRAKPAPLQPSPRPARPLGPIAGLLLSFGVELKGGLEKW